MVSSRFLPKWLPKSRDWVMLALGSLLVAAGCAMPGLRWPGRTASTTAELPPDSTVGRFHRIERLAAEAASMSQPERARVAEQLNDELTSDAPIAVKTAIVSALGRLGTDPAMRGLTSALRDTDEQLRMEACRALAGMDSPQAAELLAQTVTIDVSTDVRLAAVRGLAQHRDPRALQALGRALDDADPALQYAAMQSLRQSTGQDLGLDVREWKRIAQNPDELFRR